GSVTGAVDQASEGTERWQAGDDEGAPAQLRGTSDTTPGRRKTVRRRARRTGRRGEEADGPSDNRTGPGHDEERRGVGRQGLGYTQGRGGEGRCHKCPGRGRQVPGEGAEEREAGQASAGRPVGRQLRGPERG